MPPEDGSLGVVTFGSECFLLSCGLDALVGWLPLPVLTTVLSLPLLLAPFGGCGGGAPGVVFPLPAFPEPTGPFAFGGAGALGPGAPPLRLLPGTDQPLASPPKFVCLLLAKAHDAITAITTAWILIIFRCLLLLVLSIDRESEL